MRRRQQQYLPVRVRGPGWREIWKGSTVAGLAPGEERGKDI